MSTQDRTVAAVIGWLGALTAIIGTLLPSVSVGVFSGPALIHSADGVVIAVLALVVAWRVYRTFTDRAHPAWIIAPALGASVLLAYDWNDALQSVRVDALDLTVTRSAGTGLYVIALGLALTWGAAAWLWSIRRDTASRPDAPVLSDEQDREIRRAHALNRQG